MLVCNCDDGFEKGDCKYCEFYIEEFGTTDISEIEIRTIGDIRYMEKASDLKRNGSGCLDPTAYQAIKNIEGDENYERFKDILRTLRHMCSLADFEILNRIELKDKRTGRIYR